MVCGMRRTRITEAATRLERQRGRHSAEFSVAARTRDWGLLANGVARHARKAAWCRLDVVLAGNFAGRLWRSFSTQLGHGSAEHLALQLAPAEIGQGRRGNEESGMLARDVMTAPVVSVTPATRTRDAIELMLTHHLSGLPVLDEQGKLVGVLSEGDRTAVLNSAPRSTARASSPSSSAPAGPPMTTPRAIPASCAAS